METDQTGFSGSPPTSNSTTSTNGNNNTTTTNGTSLLGHNNNNVVKGHQRNDSPTHHTVLLKEKSKDDLDDEDEEDVEEHQQQQQQLPSISEVEGWKTASTAYYSHPLVAVIDDSAIYDGYTHKLPSLAKFQKGLTTLGKLPAIWSVSTVTSPEETQLIPASATVVTSPNVVTDPRQQQATIYLQRALEKERSVIIQQVMPDGSVQLRPLHAHHPDDEITGEVKSSDVPVEDLPPLAPASAVEVKREDDDPSVNHDNGQEQHQQDMAPMQQQQHEEDGLMTFEEPNLGTGQYSVLTNVVVTSPPEYAAAAAQNTTGGLYTLTTATGDYYREYYAPSTTEQYAQAVRLAAAAAAAASNSPSPTSNTFVTANGSDNSSGGYVEHRYVRAASGQPQAYVTNTKTALTATSATANMVELPSPDSGMGDAVTPRDAAALHQIFEYAEISQPQSLLPDQDPSGVPNCSSASTSPTPMIVGGSATGSRKGSWSGGGSDYGRTPEADKVHIPKIFSDVGFRYYLESPISTSQRRDDDRMTYINKGQYYGLTLEYVPDPDRPLRSCTVKSLVMLVFREEKSSEDELKAWKFWHSRQHSVKQRILDVDTKNSSGVVGQIEEVTHNAIAFYWNPLDGPAKVSVSVHCLSTDFSNQKGVKGLPLHLQIDTTDDLRENGVRAHRGYCQIKVFCDKGAERKTRDEERRASKRKLTATPNSRKKLDDMYHLPSERSEFYSMSDLSKPPVLFMPQDDPENCNGPELTFYAITTVPMDNNLPIGEEVKSPVVEVITPTPTKKIKFNPADRVLLYAKRADEDVFHPLHLVPPTLNGLSKSLELKYGISCDMIRNIYKRCKKGITVEMDDDIVRHYCNEDTFLIDLIKTEDGQLDVTLVEI